MTKNKFLILIIAFAFTISFAGSNKVYAAEEDEDENISVISEDGDDLYSYYSLINSHYFGYASSNADGFLSRQQFMALSVAERYEEFERLVSLLDELIFDTYYYTGKEDGYDEGYAKGYESGVIGGNKEAYDTGYNTGKQDGLTAGYNNGYNVGLEEGQEEGYADGYTDGKQDGLTEGYNNGYIKGKEDGLSAGSSSGYSDGYADGKQVGLTEGYANGYNVGSEEGYANGFIDGKQEGLSAGSSSGYRDGYTAGKQDGYNSGKQDGLTEGYKNGYTTGKQDGLDEGYNAGKQDGLTEGYNNGYTNGKKDYFDIGYSAGLENGLYDGYQSGYVEGKQDGLDEGYDEGIQDGYDEGYDEGIQDGYDDAMSNINVVIDDLKFGPLIDSTFVSSMHGQSYDDHRNLRYNFNQFRNKFVVGNFINLYDLAYNTYLSFSSVDNFDSTLQNPSDAIFYDFYINFAEPLNSISFNMQGVSEFVLYRADGTFIEQKYFVDYTDPTELAALFSNTYEVDFVSDVSPFISIKFVFSPTYCIEDLTHITFGLTTNDSYTLGFEFGKGVGFKEGSSLAYDDAYDAGYDFGYDKGYGEGYSENNFSLQSLFWTIAGIPFESFKTIWNVNFLGVYIADFITGLLLVGVAIFIIKRVMF